MDSPTRYICDGEFTSMQDTRRSPIGVTSMMLRRPAFPVVAGCSACRLRGRLNGTRRMGVHETIHESPTTRPLSVASLCRIVGFSPNVLASSSTASAILGFVETKQASRS